ncbi:diacylglycerol/lipid kinase family protein [Nocardia jejuensis]|uniref:diacylglycerol/lipid kinase family protein n=1 Tax=Nocardia jejuensis TaxID=328049 RepID=UPI00082DEB97|nr:diacylglycerol kinase family protein [Nocardia jejuensis]
MRTLLIVNPNATSTTRATRDLLAHALESRTQLTVAQTEHRGHAAELARWAADNRMDLIVVHGGDGTVNETINGFLPLPGRTQREWLPRLGIIPGGSANVFARSLGIEQDPVTAANQLIDLLADDADRRIGLGVARSPEAPKDDRWFAFSAGVGLDADVCEAIDAKRAKGKAATPARYLRTTVNQFFRARRRDPQVRLEIPGHEPVTDVHYAFVTNASPWTYLDSTPVRTNPGTSFESGLGVFAMRTMGVVPTLLIARQLLAADGNPKGHKLFREDDVPGVQVEATEPLGLQIDGDFIGRRNMVNFTAVPDILDVVAPKP